MLDLPPTHRSCACLIDLQFMIVIIVEGLEERGFLDVLGNKISSEANYLQILKPLENELISHSVNSLTLYLSNVRA